MDAFWNVFLFQSIYTCTYIIYCIECQVFDRFFGVLPAARVRGMYFHLVCEPGPQKACKYSYKPSDTCLWINNSRYTVGRPCGSLLQGVVVDAQPLARPDSRSGGNRSGSRRSKKSDQIVPNGLCFPHPNRAEGSVW